ncbi:Hypothetical predicted protein [Olea europaea subsp. europaea]|uniref:Uncharacterized protein n=1 Tax=Olea europaea subsp. europaea TaxID=158383 RepID=A0A8S0Q557_OLEEU|nr:Hypothetical predicted protein [Olea europaea subsp. europaea]
MLQFLVPTGVNVGGDLGFFSFSSRFEEIVMNHRYGQKYRVVVETVAIWGLFGKIGGYDQKKRLIGGVGGGHVAIETVVTLWVVYCCVGVGGGGGDGVGGRGGGGSNDDGVRAVVSSDGGSGSGGGM